VKSPWHVTGRFYAAEDGGLLDAGYFLHMQRIDAELFSGDSDRVRGRSE
jgi:hypothetical protein